jgi:hypothetical protein
MRAHWSSVSSWNRDTIPGFQNPTGKFIRHALAPHHLQPRASSHNRLQPGVACISAPQEVQVQTRCPRTLIPPTQPMRKLPGRSHG